MDRERGESDKTNITRERERASERAREENVGRERKRATWDMDCRGAAKKQLWCPLVHEPVSLCF